MTGLTRQDMTVLQSYADKGNRELYWNYLAQHDGNDGYGLLALGVVRNDNMPGAIANAYAKSHAREHDHITLSERQWENFGQDLVERDFARRQLRMARDQSDLALNLPVGDVQRAHDEAFRKAKIDPDAWTPRQLLEAARRQGGEAAAEDVWHKMLDGSHLGVDRLMSTTKDVVAHYNDERLPVARYMADLAAATAMASQDRSHVDPNVIGASHFYYMHDRQTQGWSSVTSSPMGPAISRVDDPRTVSELDDARAVRLERQEKSTHFHPLDPHRELARSPKSIADAGPAVAPETQMAGFGQPAGSRPTVDDLFSRLTDAAMHRDAAGMRAMSREFMQSGPGQGWLQAGREHNQAERQLAQVTERPEQAVMQQAALVHRGPVIRM